jgi:hypothetical protein
MEYAGVTTDPTQRILSSKITKNKYFVLLSRSPDPLPPGSPPDPNTFTIDNY